jgi:hypothetical protein
MLRGMNGPTTTRNPPCFATHATLTSLLVGALLTLLLFGCAVEPLPSPFTGDEPNSVGDFDSAAPPLPGDVSTPEDSDTAAPSTSITLPQSVQGALWANPELYPVLPIHVAVKGSASTVSIQLGDQSIQATDDDEDGDFLAQVPIADLAEGVHTLTASDGSATATAELHVGSEGVQFTHFDEVGRAATPRLHRHNDGLWLTWEDRRTEPRRTWLQQIDGAGRGLGEPIGLTPAGKDVVYGRTVPGNNTLAVLYQTKNPGYQNWLTVVDWTGDEVVPPMALDPVGAQGSWGGDLSFDGEGFVVVWRTYSADMDKGEIHWLRLDETTLETTGPVVVTQSGQEDPHGDFLPFAFVGAEALGDHTLITFVRDHYNSLLDMSVGRCQAAVVHRDGSVGNETLLPTPLAMPFGFQAFVHRVHGELVALWTAVSLYDEELNPPHRIIGGRINTKIITVPGSAQAHVILQGPTERGEMVLIEHPTHFGTMAWTDQRSKVADPIDGRIQLFVAAVDENLVADPHTLIPHARFIQDTSQVNGQALGTNTFLLWLDERHGGTLGNSHPEVYFETIWE